MKDVRMDKVGSIKMLAVVKVARGKSSFYCLYFGNRIHHPPPSFPKPQIIIILYNVITGTNLEANKSKLRGHRSISMDHNHSQELCSAGKEVLWFAIVLLL